MSFREACARALRALSSRLARRRAVADWYLPNSSEEERTAVFAPGTAEAAGQVPAQGGDGQQRGRSGADVPEALFLPFVGKKHADVPFPVQPFSDLAFRQLPPHLLHHEVPGVKAAQGIVMDGQGEVLLPLRVLRRCGEDAHVPPFLAEGGRNDQVARLDPGPQGFHACRFRQDEVDVLRLPEGNLGVHVKFPDGFNLVVKKTPGVRDGRTGAGKRPECRRGGTTARGK